MFSPGKANRIRPQNLIPLLLGPAILAFGLYNIHEPCGITEGGILGMTLLLHHWLGISPSVSGFIMNMAGYAWGVRFLGRGFLKRSLISATAFSVFYALFERFPPLLPSLAAWPLLAAVVGAGFVGVGVGLAVRTGAAPGGDDAVAMVLAHVTHRPIGRMYLLCDLVVLLGSLSYIPVANVLCSLVTVTISSWIIGRLTVPAKPEAAAGAAEA